MRIPALFLALVLALFLTGCGDLSASAEVDWASLTENDDAAEDSELLEALVSQSDFAVNATCWGLEQYDGYVYYHFTVNEVLYGDYSGTELYVYELGYGYDPPYTFWGRYTLVLMNGITSDDSEHPHYLSVSDVSFPEGSPYLLGGREVAPPEGQRMEDYLQSLRESLTTALQ